MRQITIHRTTRTYSTLAKAEAAALKLLESFVLQNEPGVTFTIMAGTEMDHGATVRYSPVFFLQGAEVLCCAGEIARKGFHVVG